MRMLTTWEENPHRGELKRTTMANKRFILGVDSNIDRDKGLRGIDKRH